MISNNFTKFPNNLFNILINSKLSGTQLAIILAIIRATYGYHKESETLGIQYFHKSTRYNRQNIKIELHKLIDRKIITVVNRHTFGCSRRLKMNENINEWLGY
jgi:phage replication O-like protein O